MLNRLKFLRYVQGITLVETIITLAVLGAVIVPLINLFVMCAKINNESRMEYKSILEAQRYIEEINALPFIDTTKYIYDSSIGAYIRTVIQNDNEYGAEIKINFKSNFLYSIEVKIFDDGEEINNLMATKIVQ